MTDKARLEAAIKAAAWAYAAALGANEAQRALDRVKSEVGNSQWGRQ